MIVLASGGTLTRKVARLAPREDFKQFILIAQREKARHSGNPFDTHFVVFFLFLFLQRSSYHLRGAYYKNFLFKEQIYDMNVYLRILHISDLM